MAIRFSCRHAPLWCAALFISFVDRSDAADLTVIVDHVKAGAGEVRVALFNDRNSFPNQRLQGQKAAAGEPSVTLSFSGLPAGRYAVSAFQDLNQNEKLDTNAFGKPREPYGFSRNARGRFGPPSFDDASVELGTESRTLRISLE